MYNANKRSSYLFTSKCKHAIYYSLYIAHAMHTNNVSLDVHEPEATESTDKIYRASSLQPVQRTWAAALCESALDLRSQIYNFAEISFMNFPVIK